MGHGSSGSHAGRCSRGDCPQCTNPDHPTHPDKQTALEEQPPGVTHCYWPETTKTEGWDEFVVMRPSNLRARQITDVSFKFMGKGKEPEFGEPGDYLVDFGGGEFHVIAKLVFEQHFRRLDRTLKQDESIEMVGVRAKERAVVDNLRSNPETSALLDKVLDAGYGICSICGKPGLRELGGYVCENGHEIEK